MAQSGPKKAVAKTETPALPSITELPRITESHPEFTALEATNAPIPEAFVSQNPRRKSSILSLAVTALIVPGLFATVALPAYAFQPVQDTEATDAAVALQQLKEVDAQSVTVASDAPTAAVSRDAFTLTSAAEMQAAAAAAARLAAASYSGAGGGGGMENPPYPYFSLDAIVSVAMQYQGVPYASGGSTPAGFDCSGFVQWVYGQVGVSIPRTTGSQSAAGTRIARSAALPGDIVVMGGHNGIYLGDGMMIDSPVPGDVVGVHRIWTSNYTIVRYGI